MHLDAFGAGFGVSASVANFARVRGLAPPTLSPSQHTGISYLVSRLTAGYATRMMSPLRNA